jgi:hypothetical protein
MHDFQLLYCMYIAGPFAKYREGRLCPVQEPFWQVQDRLCPEI